MSSDSADGGRHALATASTPDVPPRSVHGIDEHGIVNAGAVWWNLATPALYEAAVRRGEGVIAHNGPLACDTGQHTGRSPGDKYVVREPGSEANVWWGSGQPAAGAGALRRALRARARLARRPGAVRPGLLGRRRPALPAAAAGHHHLRLAQPVRPQPLPAGDAGRSCAGIEPAFTILDVPGLHRRPGARRHALADRHRPQLRPPAGADRRHAIRRRDQEVGLHHPQLPAAAAGRAADALLGQRRAARRRGALLRPLRHRQDDPLGRPRPHAHRRRRARLERPGRLQLRGRLLRQGDQPLARGRAGDLRHHAAASAPCWRTSSSTRSRAGST